MVLECAGGVGGEGGDRRSLKYGKIVVRLYIELRWLRAEGIDGRKWRP